MSVLTKDKTLNDSKSFVPSHFAFYYNIRRLGFVFKINFCTPRYPKSIRCLVIITFSLFFCSVHVFLQKQKYYLEKSASQNVCFTIFPTLFFISNLIKFHVTPLQL